ncbi:MAG: FAD-binding protein [candidate division Zixibacteria bacterium]|nr:FAD-binding protein [candidate division Zixibacteria bacterium]
MNSAEEIKAAFRAATDSDGFFDSPDVLNAYMTDNLFEPVELPICGVKPKDTDEIIKAVRAANDTLVDLIPCSSGPLRFRGDTAAPHGTPAVVVDLSGMKKILRIDRRNKVAIIEPGVTFDELQALARTHHMRALTPLLPRATKSVIASYLEREPITIPKYHWDMTDPMLCVEVVFGTGDVFRTGGAAGPGSLGEQWAAGASQKNPMGPAQTDVLRILQGAQGTMGIVAWASVKLELWPKLRKAYFIKSDNVEPLVETVYEMTRLRLGDELLILNNFALAHVLGHAGAEIIESAKRQAPWTLFYCVSGYEYYPELRVEYQENDIAEIAQEHGLEIHQEVPGLNALDMAATIDKPSEEPYWKQRYKGGCCEIFFLTTMDHMPTYLTVMEEKCQEFRFPSEHLGVYAQPVQHGRACHLEFLLPYDPVDPKETKRASNLFLAASRALSDRGAFFSRPYGPWAELAYSRCPDTVRAITKVKEIVDPKRILNRGRICL